MKTKLNLKKFLTHLSDEMQEGIDSCLKECEVDNPYLKRMGMVGDLTIYKGEERIVLATISKVALDRDREVVMSSGMDISQYEKNPVILVNHNWSGIPVGQSLHTMTYPDRVRQKIQFDSDEESLTIFNKYQSKSLRAFSVGFVPMEIAENGAALFNQYADMVIQAGFMDIKDVDNTKRFITKSLLIENSVVTIPANTEAIAEAISDTEEVVPEEVIETQQDTSGMLTIQTQASNNDDVKTKDVSEDIPEEDEILSEDDLEEVLDIIDSEVLGPDDEENEDPENEEEIPVVPEIKTVIRLIKRATPVEVKQLTDADISFIAKQEIYKSFGGI